MEKINMTQQSKVGRLRMFRFEKDGKSEFKVHVDLEDGTTLEAKAFQNNSDGGRVYWAGNVFKVETEEVKF